MKLYLLTFLVCLSFGLTGCQEIFQREEQSIPVEQFNSLQSINSYLTTHVADTGFQGQAYCAYEVLDAQPKGEKVNVYAWVLCLEYYSDEEELRLGTGSSLPVALTVQRNADDLSVVEHHEPRDGSLYAEDLQDMFSKRFRDKIESETTDDHNQRVDRLQDEIEKKAGVR